MTKPKIRAGLHFFPYADLLVMMPVGIFVEEPVL
jgi:hypothetical protein